MTTVAPDLEIPIEEIKAGKRVTEYHLMWWAFRRDPLAVLSLIILLAFILGAIFAPNLTPYPEQGRGVRFGAKIAPNIKPSRMTHSQF